LPTPFRCVATDLLSAEQVVFKSGSLSRALRATMSLPGIFEPVRHGNRLLVDGGLLNNLPVDVVKEMGADFIIAVDLGYPKAKAEEVESLLGVVSRSIDVMMQANVTTNAKLANIILRPDLTGYNSFSFGASKKIIEQGYKEAEHHSQALADLSLDELSWR